MENKEQNLRPETSLFVEALQAVLQAEDKTLSGFSLIYGDTIPKDGKQTPGEEMYYKSGLPALFEEVKDSLKNWIGTTFELGISGLLDGPKKEEGERC